MSVLTGLTGSVAMPNGRSYKLQSVAISAGRELIDVTSFGAEWRERVACIKDLAGTAAGLLTTGSGTASDPFDIDAAEGQMTITFASGNHIVFNAVIGQIQMVNSATGVAAMSFAWAKGSADVAVSWA